MYFILYYYIIINQHERKQATWTIIGDYKQRKVLIPFHMRLPHQFPLLLLQWWWLLWVPVPVYSSVSTTFIISRPIPHHQSTGGDGYCSRTQMSQANNAASCDEKEGKTQKILLGSFCYDIY